MRALTTLIHRPQMVYGALVPALVACWFLAGVGGDRTASDGGWHTVGSTFWALFGILVIVTVLYTAAVLVNKFAQRSPAGSGS